MIQVGSNTNGIGVNMQGQLADVPKPDRFSITGVNYYLFFNFYFFLYVY